jgi:hypothetical protein
MILLALQALLCLQSQPSSGTAPTAVQPARDEGWSWRVVPYLFASNLDGTLDIGGNEFTTEVEFSDLASHLDFGAAAFFEGRHGPWAFALDGTYIDLGEDAEGPAGVQGEVDFLLTMLGLTGFYRVGPGSPFEVALGLRYLGTEQEVQVGPESSESESDLLDGYVGARAVWPFAERWRFSLYGDVGAGDSDLTWQGLMNLGYDFGNWGLNFGYRVLAYEFDEGSTELDIAMEGWMLGFEYRF